MKTLLLFVVSLVFFSQTLFAQSPCPSYADILNKQAYFDEFGIYCESPFQVSIDDGTLISSKVPTVGCGVGTYYYMSFDIQGSGGNSAASPTYSELDTTSWHKVYIIANNIGHTFWVKPPSANATTQPAGAPGTGQPDFVAHIDGSEYDRAFTNIPWTDFVKTVQPLSVSISGPVNLTTGQTATYYSNVSGGSGTISYNWEYRQINPTGPWQRNSASTSANYFLTMPSYSIELALNVTRGAETSSTSKIVVNDTGLFAKGNMESSAIPSETKLYPNYPNPFNPTTQIKFSLKKAGLVSLIVYNSLGQVVANLVNDNKQAGNYSVNFDASKLASGIYLYKLVAGDYVKTEKMILMK